MNFNNQRKFLIELTLSWFILAINIPFSLYIMQFGLEQADSPQIITVLIATLCAGFISVIGKTICMKSANKLTTHLYFTRFAGISTLCIGILGWLEIFPQYWSGIFIASQGVLLFWLWELNLHPPTPLKSLMMGIQICIWITAGSIYFLWVNFYWWSPEMLVGVNLIILISMFILIYRQGNANFVEIGSQEHNYLSIRGLNATYVFLGLLVGLFLTLYTLVSENIAITHQTSVINGINLACVAVVCLALLSLTNSNDKSKKLFISFSNSAVSLLMAISLVVGFMGIPWYLATTEVISDTTAGYLHLFAIPVIYYVMASFLTVASESNQTIGSAIGRIVLFILGFIIGIAGFLFGGMNYRVGPEVGIAFTALIIMGILVNWRNSQKIHKRRENRDGN